MRRYDSFGIRQAIGKCVCIPQVRIPCRNIPKGVIPMKKKFISCTLALVLLLSVSLGVSALDNITETPNEALYTREALAIFDKIDALAKAKAEVLHYKSMYNLTDDNGDPVLLALINTAESIRDELIEMGAKPSSETLAALKFEPVEVNGVLIGDFEDFEYTYGEVYDLWGIEQTVNASYGTYYTYDILIQDVTGGEILATSISQNQRPGWDLHAAGSSVSPMIRDKINDAAFDRIVECVAAGSPYSSGVMGAYSAVKSLFSIINGIDPDDPITVSGNTSSHIIYCDIFPTVHFIFVRDSLTGPWQHSLTTNRAQVEETHTWYYATLQNGSPVILSSWDSDDGAYYYDALLTPEDYRFRLTNAISAYRANHSLYVDKLSGYTIVVKEGTADLEGEEAFTLSITCPDDQFDLFCLAYNDTRSTRAIIVFAIAVILVIVVMIVGRHKNKSARIHE